MYPHVTQFETRRQELERGHEVEPSCPKPASSPGGPPRYKLALLTWAGAYALITLIIGLLGPAIAAWPLLLRTLLVSATMVVGLTWVVMPRLTRLFRGWLTAGA
jgi:antibiotic biosynthesis monooxygenase (ABM) superfamily enzyme